MGVEETRLRNWDRRDSTPSDQDISRTFSGRLQGLESSRHEPRSGDRMFVHSRLGSEQFKPVRGREKIPFPVFVDKARKHRRPYAIRPAMVTQPISRRALVAPVRNASYGHVLDVGCFGFVRLKPKRPDANAFRLIDAIRELRSITRPVMVTQPIRRKAFAPGSERVEQRRSMRSRFRSACVSAPGAGSEFGGSVENSRGETGRIRSLELTGSRPESIISAFSNPRLKGLSRQHQPGREATE